jgi:hypothetical protein
VLSATLISSYPLLPIQQASDLAMSENFGADYTELLKKYHDLAHGIRMVRRAVDKAFRVGVLPPIERMGITPLEECEAIARVIYAATAKQHEHVSGAMLAGRK